jgi:hypothetical protein
MTQEPDMPPFIVVLKDGKQYSIDAATYAARDGCLCFLDAERNDVAAFAFMNVEAVYREGLGQPLRHHAEVLSV